MIEQKEASQTCHLYSFKCPNKRNRGWLRSDTWVSAYGQCL